jgi:hypothetical protein
VLLLLLPLLPLLLLPPLPLLLIIAGQPPVI